MPKPSQLKEPSVIQIYEKVVQKMGKYSADQCRIEVQFSQSKHGKIWMNSKIWEIERSMHCTKVTKDPLKNAALTKWRRKHLERIQRSITFFQVTILKHRRKNEKEAHRPQHGR